MPPPPLSEVGWGHIVIVQILLVSAVSVGLRVTAQDISKASGWILTCPQGYKRFFMLNVTDGPKLPILKGTATLIMSMFYQKELYKP